MQRHYLTAASLILGLLLPSTASAEDAFDPLACARVELEQEDGFSNYVFEQFAASITDPSIELLSDEKSLSTLFPVVKECIGDTTKDQGQSAILVLGIVGDQMVIEGRRRLSDLGFEAQRYDDVFVPALREMPLEELDLMNFRPPNELRGPVFALRDEIIENSGADTGEVTELLVTYTTALVGVVAAQKVIAEIENDR